MAIFSCVHVSILKIIALCAIGIAFVIQTVGFSAEKWDEIDADLFTHDYVAHQSLWSYYDKYSDSHIYALYDRFADAIPPWKMQIIYLETVGFGMAVLSFGLMIVASFITRIASKTNLQFTFKVMASIGLFIGGSCCITGVKLYKDHYMDILTTNGLSVVQSSPGAYHLTWAPYMCIASGAMYFVVGILLIIDVVISAAKRKPVVPVNTTWKAATK